MITDAARGFASAALTPMPLLAATPAQAAEITTLTEGVRALPLAAESRTGDERSSFKPLGRRRFPSPSTTSGKARPSR